jgi:AP-4 complex subunit sigma-1
VYRRYASLFVLAGVDSDENALAVLEVVHAFVESLDRYFGAVCELDIMFHLDKARPPAQRAEACVPIAAAGVLA